MALGLNYFCFLLPYFSKILKGNIKNTLVPLAPQTQNLISVCDHSSSLCAAVITQLGWHQHNFLSLAEG